MQTGAHTTPTAQSGAQILTNSTAGLQTGTQAPPNATTRVQAGAQTNVTVGVQTSTQVPTNPATIAQVQTHATLSPIPGVQASSTQTQNNAQVNVDLLDLQRYDDCYRSCSQPAIGGIPVGINPGIQQLVGKHLRGIGECSVSLK